MSTQEAILIPTGHPDMLQGDVQLFDEAVRDRVCPHLNQMGELAIQNMRETQAALEAGDMDAIADMAAQLVANQSPKPKEIEHVADISGQQETLRVQERIAEQHTEIPDTSLVQEVARRETAAIQEHEVAEIIEYTSVEATEPVAKATEKSAEPTATVSEPTQRSTTPSVESVVSEQPKPLRDAVEVTMKPERTAAEVVAEKGEVAEFTTVEEATEDILPVLSSDMEPSESDVQIKVETVDMSETEVFTIAEDEATVEVVTEDESTEVLKQIDTIVQEFVPATEQPVAREIIERIEVAIAEEIMEIQQAIEETADINVLEISTEELPEKLEALIEELVERFNGLDPDEIRKHIVQLRTEMIQAATIEESAVRFGRGLMGMNEHAKRNQPKQSLHQRLHSILGRIAMLRPQPV